MNIRDAVTKPSQALEAMVEGLTNTDGVGVAMGEFYSIGRLSARGGEMCFGCAATHTLRALTKKELPVDGMLIGTTARCQFWGFDDWDEVNRFEQAMDTARLGDLSELFGFLGKDPSSAVPFSDKFTLVDYNWERELPLVKALISDLQADGL